MNPKKPRGGQVRPKVTGPRCASIRALAIEYLCRSNLRMEELATLIGWSRRAVVYDLQVSRIVDATPADRYAIAAGDFDAERLDRYAELLTRLTGDPLDRAVRAAYAAAMKAARSVEAGKLVDLFCRDRWPLHHDFARIKRDRLAFLNSNEALLAVLELPGNAAIYRGCVQSYRASVSVYLRTLRETARRFASNARRRKIANDRNESRARVIKRLDRAAELWNLTHSTVVQLSAPNAQRSSRPQALSTGERAILVKLFGRRMGGTVAIVAKPSSGERAILVRLFGGGLAGKIAIADLVPVIDRAEKP